MSFDPSFVVETCSAGAKPLDEDDFYKLQKSYPSIPPVYYHLWDGEHEGWSIHYDIRFVDNHLINCIDFQFYGAYEDEDGYCRNLAQIIESNDPTWEYHYGFLMYQCIHCKFLVVRKRVSPINETANRSEA